MDSANFYKDLQEVLEKDFPITFKEIENGRLNVDWTYLISPEVVEIPTAVRDEMKNAIQSLFHFSRNLSTPPSHHIQNDSVLMSYDFHTHSDGRAKLIEVNTNASGFLISCFAEAAHQSKSYFDLEAIQSLKSSFLLEHSKGSQSSETLQIAIVDDQIESQKMKFEFYLYKELFEHWGWKSEICEASDLKLENKKVMTPGGLAVNFIYNRTTDFFLTETSHQVLQSAWKEGFAVVSPQPVEYERLADKNRLIEFQNTSNLPKPIEQVLLKTYDIAHFTDPDELWAERKNYFFKPKNSFGGKSAYRGQSLSRKVFQRMLEDDALVQEYFPPEKLKDWKFDIRCYAYKDQLQHIAARLYQGQLTNFSTPFGGFGPVRLKS
ncbi:MAG TPA: hypothetical protein DCL41_03535 [Bdellovibrionales bacterium]|nr:hypothetical protein [Pseudobdellovibrionaceae bacterium]HAG90913.1 hypothetical protein [Bdellovibrionales bacterium]|tara:strand:+ start:5259 stop:6392 length:1134 start_codon:yes stop_codon:yes gene_type:complete